MTLTRVKQTRPAANNRYVPAVNFDVDSDEACSGKQSFTISFNTHSRTQDTSQSALSSPTIPLSFFLSCKCLPLRVQAACTGLKVTGSRPLPLICRLFLSSALQGNLATATVTVAAGGQDDWLTGSPRPIHAIQ